MNRRPLPPDRGYDVRAPQDCPDPVAALLAAHRVGGLVSLRTSGTTGCPREVLRTAASWVDSFPVVAELIGLAQGSRAWVPGPIGATMNLYAAALATYRGASLTDSPRRASHAFLTPAGLLQLVTETGADGSARGRRRRPARARSGRTSRGAGMAGQPLLRRRAVVVRRLGQRRGQPPPVPWGGRRGPKRRPPLGQLTVAVRAGDRAGGRAGLVSGPNRAWQRPPLGHCR